MITIAVREASLQGTPDISTLLLHNLSERILFTGKVFSTEDSHILVLALDTGAWLTPEATDMTNSGEGLYLYGDVDLSGIEAETVFGSKTTVTVWAWLYNETSGNYECYTPLTLRLAPDPLSSV